MHKAIQTNRTEDIACPYLDNPTPVCTMNVAFPYPLRNAVNGHLTDLPETLSDVDKAYSHFRFISKLGLKAITGVVDADGNKLAWEGDEVSEDALDTLSEIKLPSKSGYDSLLTWLGAEIWRRNTLDEGAGKN